MLVASPVKRLWLKALLHDPASPSWFIRRLFFLLTLVNENKMKKVDSTLLSYPRPVLPTQAPCSKLPPPRERQEARQTLRPVIPQPLRPWLACG